MLINIQATVHVGNSFTTFQINEESCMKSQYAEWRHWLCYFHVK